MAEHTAQARKAAEPAASAKAPAAAAPGSYGELLNRRSESVLGTAAQLLARRGAAAARAAPPAPGRAVGPQPVQRLRPPNRTGLPDRLKAGVEALSGLSMDDVRVHRGSSEPAKLGALAYAHGRDIHLGPGHERHLPHEAWHVVQQKQGRVRPTFQLKTFSVNDEPRLEEEADLMGAKALVGSHHALSAADFEAAPTPAGAVQMTLAERQQMTGEGESWATIRAITQQLVNTRLAKMNNAFGGTVSFGTPAVLEPLVRRGAAMPTYAALLGGMSHTEMVNLSNWGFGDLPFSGLGGDEQALMAITHWSEVGREFGTVLQKEFWEVIDARLGEPAASADADEDMRTEILNSTFAQPASKDKAYKPPK